MKEEEELEVQCYALQGKRGERLITLASRKFQKIGRGINKTHSFKLKLDKNDFVRILFWPTKKIEIEQPCPCPRCPCLCKGAVPCFGLAIQASVHWLCLRLVVQQLYRGRLISDTVHKADTITHSCKAKIEIRSNHGSRGLRPLSAGR